jgi:hypothetical protein
VPAIFFGSSIKNVLSIFNGSQLRGDIKRKIHFEITLQCSKAEKQNFLTFPNQVFRTTFFGIFEKSSEKILKDHSLDLMSVFGVSFDFMSEKWMRSGDDDVTPLHQEKLLFEWKIF